MMNDPNPAPNSNVAAATLFDELKELAKIFAPIKKKTSQVAAPQKSPPQEMPQERHGPISINVDGEFFSTTSMKCQGPAKLKRAKEVDSIENFSPESNKYFRHPPVEEWTMNPTPDKTKSLLSRITYVNGNNESVSPSVPQLSLEDLTKNDRATTGTNGKGLATMDLQELLYMTILIPLYYIIHRAISPNESLDHHEGVNLAVNTASTDRDGSTLEKMKTSDKTEVNDRSPRGQQYAVTVFFTMMFIACNFEEGETEEGHELLHDVINRLGEECVTQDIGTFFKMLGKKELVYASSHDGFIQQLALTRSNSPPGIARTYATLQGQACIMKTLLDEDFKKNCSGKTKKTFAKLYTTRVMFLANILHWMQAFACFGSNPKLPFPSKLEESNLGTNLIQYIQAKTGNKPSTNDLVKTTRILYKGILYKKMHHGGVSKSVTKAAMHLFSLQSIESGTNILSTVQMILFSNLIRAVKGNNLQKLTKRLGPWWNVNFFPNVNPGMSSRANLHIQRLQPDQQDVLTTLNNISQLQTTSSEDEGYTCLFGAMACLIKGNIRKMVRALTITGPSSLPFNATEERRTTDSDQVEQRVVLQDDAKTNATQSTVAISISDTTTVQDKSYASAFLAALNERNGRLPIGTDDRTLDPLIGRTAELLESNQAKAKSVVDHGDTGTRGTDFDEDEFVEDEHFERTKHVEDKTIEATTLVDVGDIGTSDICFDEINYCEPPEQYLTDTSPNLVSAIRFGWQFRRGNEHPIPNDAKTDKMFDDQLRKYINMHEPPKFLPNQNIDTNYLNQVSIKLQCHITLVNPEIGKCLSIGPEQSTDKLFIKRRYDQDRQFIGYACLVRFDSATLLARIAAPLTEEELNCAGGMGEDAFQMAEPGNNNVDLFKKDLSKIPGLNGSEGDDSDSGNNSFKGDSEL